MSSDSKASLANLSKGSGFKKGQSGNPSGRPHRMRTLVTNALLEKLAAIDNDDPKKRTCAERLADILYKCATEPDPELDKTRIMALSEIIDRCEGKPKQQLELNDITAEIRQRSDEDLMYHMEHGYWPEDEYTHKRNQKILEATARLEAAKPPTDTTQ